MSDVSESLKLLTKNKQPWGIHSHPLPKMSDHEQIAQVTHQNWANHLFFWGNHLFALFFAKTKWENSQPCHSLIFGERPEQSTHGYSFLVGNLSNLLTSLIKKEEMSKSLVFFKKPTKMYQKTFYSNFFERISCFLWAKERKGDSLMKKSKSLYCKERQ